MNDKNAALGLFFTFRVSLEEWQRVGNLERELRPYYAWCDHFKDVYLFTYGTKRDRLLAPDAPVNLHIVPKPWAIPTLIYSLILPLVQYRYVRQCRILKTNQMNGSWTAVIASHLSSGRMIVRCGFEWYEFAVRGNKSWWKRSLIYLISYVGYHAADRIIVTTNDSKAFVIQHFKLPADKIAVIPNYIDTDIFAPDDTVMPEANRILFIGRFTSQKNLPSLLSAISQIPEAHLVLIGNGEERDGIEQYVGRELKGKVSLLGNRPNHELPDELRRSAMFVLPSFYEGNPKALLEAMACGVACVGARSPGIIGVIEHGVNGYLCEPDADSLERAIRDLLSDKNLRRQFGRAARQTVLGNYSFAKCFEKERVLYKII